METPGTASKRRSPIALIVITLVILAGVAWYLFTSQPNVSGSLILSGAPCPEGVAAFLTMQDQDGKDLGQGPGTFQNLDGDCKISFSFQADEADSYAPILTVQGPSGEQSGPLPSLTKEEVGNFEIVEEVPPPGQQTQVPPLADPPTNANASQTPSPGAPTAP